MNLLRIFEDPQSPPYVIAEIGFNHEGDMDLAVRMIREAADAGADAVKFQTFKAGDLALPDAPHFAAIAAGELSPSQHAILAAAAGEAGVDFLSTPFSLEAVGLLEAVGVPAFKVASMDVTNNPLLTRVAAAQKPVLLSTGMADLEEIGLALDVLRSRGTRQVALLHCVSHYPARAEALHLGAMKTLAQTFEVPVGYSDHFPGIAACLAAGVLGARVIETHFTLDSSRSGGDHGHSANPADLCRLVTELDAIRRMAGDPKVFQERPDRAQAALFRRGLYAAHDLRSGHPIGAEDLLTCRPVSELGPNDMEELLGKPLRCDVKAHQPLRRSDVEG